MYIMYTIIYQEKIILQSRIQLCTAQVEFGERRAGVKALITSAKAAVKIVIRFFTGI